VVFEIFLVSGDFGRKKARNFKFLGQHLLK